MQIIDNLNVTLKDDIKKTVKKNSKISIAAACFSIYAFQELKKELENIEQLRFIFTSPTFAKDINKKEQKEFYIPKLNRERALYGTEFEVKLKNELTQKAIAKECADWIKRKAKFKTNISNENMIGFMNVDESTYTFLKEFTTVDLGCERGNNAYYSIPKMENCEAGRHYLDLFENLWNDKERMKDVTEEVIYNISEAYKENPPEYIYFYTLYNIFSEFLQDISEDELPNEATGFKDSKIWNMLYDFQKDAALGVINKLEKYNGCILADSVGLGKTFTALAVIKYYEKRNKKALVLCPKKLSENWNTYKSNYKNNPVIDDRLGYDVLYHTDISRKSGVSNGLNLNMVNWEMYDLLVIDESHNFRNGGQISGKDKKENRYLQLMNKVIRKGIVTKVLMLSATPVNNRFQDLKNQLELAYEGDTDIIDKKLDTKKSINEIFRQAQKAFNDWTKLEIEERNTENLLKNLDFEFFEVLDSVTIARSRKHIEKYYESSKVGKFPKRLKPISKRPSLTNLENAINYNEIYQQLMSLNLAIYTPSNYILDSKLRKYNDLNDNKNLTQSGREEGIRRLMSINLLKRLESSVYSFSLTIRRIKSLIDSTLNIIKNYKSGNQLLELYDYKGAEDFDEDDLNTDYFSVGKKVKIDIKDMDYITWEAELKSDAENLELLQSMINDIKPENDTKLQTLLSLIDEKIKNPINKDNKKILIFTAFADTANYLYDNVNKYVKEKYNLNAAKITGSSDAKCSIPKLGTDFNTLLTLFSPKSKDKNLLLPDEQREIDILVATDCISEGQNLQDCDYLINYDIHWNPVRIIQRFGRIDRIGSENECIQLVNFWPDMDLDEYINLKARVETRMKISILTSTGDDNIISPEEKGDLEYRKQQLKRLQEEVVDIEEMNSGISIMDLGLNEYRMDLLEYTKKGIEFKKIPTGLHSVVEADEENPKGVIFVLKNINESINRDNRNRIHPFYMVYIDSEGEVVTDYLNPKKILDTLKILSKGKTEPIHHLCKKFNEETDDGKNMQKISELLSSSIDSILNKKEESDIQSLFTPGGTSALISDIKGIDDFELISFFVVR